MNDRISEKLKCPFYKDIIRSKRLVGLECESLMHENVLGFQTTHFTRFRNNQDLKDYAEIFCCANWTDCPYYHALMLGRYAKLDTDF